MSYVYSRPASASFTGAGMTGYQYGPLNHKGVELHYVDVQQGHDTFQISKKVTRIYYILTGTGHFTIEDQRYDVGPGSVVEVPPKVEYSYSGKMSLIVLSTPRWFGGNDTSTRWNPDVVRESPWAAPVRRGFFTRVVRARALGKSPARAWLRVNERVWRFLPLGVKGLRPVRWYGKFLYTLARLQGDRRQALGTYFFRNRPALELIRRLVDKMKNGETLRVAVLGCSTGAEVYSLAWAIRSARPDLMLTLHAVDISDQAVNIGKAAVYSSEPSKVTRTAITERMTAAEVDTVFKQEGDRLVVKPQLRQGIQWYVGDIRSEAVRGLIGLNDMVLANNFLCHMDPPDAEECLRSIGHLVKPGGYVFVAGVDLEVRSKIARELGWQPVQELLEEIHDGDPTLRKAWPFDYTGLEHLDKRREDWTIRYAATFKVTGECKGAENVHELRMQKSPITLRG